MRVKGLECATFSTYQGARESERKGRKEVVERKENRYRVFFFFLLYWGGADRVPAPKKFVYCKSDPTHTRWKKSNPYLKKNT
jgi:hypothetical protein